MSCKYTCLKNFVCFSVHNHNKQINYIGLLEALSTLIFTIRSGALDIFPSPPVTQPGVLGDWGARVGFNRQYPSVHFITDIPLVGRGGRYFVSIIFHSFHHVNTATVTAGWVLCCVVGWKERFLVRLHSVIEPLPLIYWYGTCFGFIIKQIPHFSTGRWVVWVCVCVCVCMWARVY